MRTLTAAAISIAMLISSSGLAMASPPPPAHDTPAPADGGGHGTETKPEVKKVVKPTVKAVKLEGQTSAAKAEPKADRPAPHLPEPKATGNTKAANPTAREVGKVAKGNAKSAESDNEVDITTADAALKALQEGNERWVAGTAQNPSSGKLRRKMTAEEGQKPFVSIITCSDSRIPVERVFDRGVGDMFVVRVAGNVTNTGLTGTLEYGVEHLHTPLLVVMGHAKCGAVKATVETMASNCTLPPNIASLAASIQPAVERARKQNPNAEGSGLVELAVRENVWQTVFDLYKSSPELVSMVEQGKLKVVGAVLDISTGQVDWLGEHPWQDALISAFSRAQDTAHGKQPAETAEAAKPVDEGRPTATAPTEGQHGHR